MLLTSPKPTFVRHCQPVRLLVCLCHQCFLALNRVLQLFSGIRMSQMYEHAIFLGLSAANQPLWTVASMLDWSGHARDRGHARPAVVPGCTT